MDPEPDLTDGFRQRRHRMVARQIEERGVTDSLLLEAMRKVPRHLFVAPNLRDSAYEDRPLPIGEDQTISQPFIVARMAQLSGIGPHDRVLEVGAGCGYAAAVFGEMASEVVAVEVRSALAERARQTVTDLGYTNIRIVAGRVESIPPEERFDRVLAAAAAPQIPEAFEERLAEGGRLVVPVGNRFSQHLWTVDAREGQLRRERHEAVAFVPLV